MQLIFEQLLIILRRNHISQWKNPAAGALGHEMCIFIIVSYLNEKIPHKNLATLHLLMTIIVRLHIMCLAIFISRVIVALESSKNALWRIFDFKSFILSHRLCFLRILYDSRSSWYRSVLNLNRETTKYLHMRNQWSLPKFNLLRISKNYLKHQFSCSACLSL